MTGKLHETTEEIFKEINKELYKIGAYAEIALFGGQLGLYHLGESDYRMTMDIDVMLGNIEDKALKILNDYGVHSIGGVMEIPPIEEVTMKEVLEYSNLKVYIPDIEMFALSKIMTTRPKDYYDLKDTKILDYCDLNRLKELIDYYQDDLLWKENPNNNYLSFDDFLKKRNLK